METNPYAPPTAPVADVASARLRPRSVIVMILLSLVSFGLYYPIWFLRRRAAFNQLDSPRKLPRWPFFVALAWFASGIVVGFVAGFERALTGSGGISEETRLIFSGVRLLVGILMLMQCFRTKEILEDHFGGPGDQVPSPLLGGATTLSGVMTFFFQIFYLQYAINQHLSSTSSDDPGCVIRDARIRD